MFKKILDFFDKFEDKSRRWLSRRPLSYAFIGGAGVVIFWRGIWHTMDFIMMYCSSSLSINRSLDINAMVWWDGPLSIIIGMAILMATGIFTSSFIGNEIIISGIKGEKKMVEKNELEMLREEESLKSIKKEIQVISSRLEKIENKSNAEMEK